MKKVLLACLFIAASAQIFAQTGDCEPDPMFNDSVGVFPLPYVEGEGGGIPDTACLNTPYQTNFTIVVDTFTIGTVEAVPDFLVIDSVLNLPEGLTFKCNPEDCTYLPQEPGCASIYGIPTGDAGVYSLEIYGTAFFLGGAISQAIAFPDPSIAPGEYLLYVREEGSENCTVISSLPESPEAINSVSIAPNPFNGFTQVSINAEESGSYLFTVTDLLGKVVATQNTNVTVGDNQFTFDGSNLAKGVYIYSLSQGKNVVSGKFVVSE